MRAAGTRSAVLLTGRLACTGPTIVGATRVLSGQQQHGSDADFDATLAAVRSALLGGAHAGAPLLAEVKQGLVSTKGGTARTGQSVTPGTRFVSEFKASGLHAPGSADRTRVLRPLMNVALLRAGVARDAAACEAAFAVLQALDVVPTSAACNAWLWATLLGPRGKHEQTRASEPPTWPAKAGAGLAVAARVLLERLLLSGLKPDADTLMLGLIAASAAGPAQGDVDWPVALSLWSSLTAGLVEGGVPVTPTLQAWDAFSSIAAAAGERQEALRIVSALRAAVASRQLYSQPSPAFLLEGGELSLHPVLRMPRSVHHNAMLACLYSGQPMQAFSLVEAMTTADGLAVDDETISTLLLVAANGPVARIPDLLAEVGHVMATAGWKPLPQGLPAEAERMSRPVEGRKHPTAQHYALMVHAAGRSGDLPRAFRLLQAHRCAVKLEAALPPAQGRREHEAAFAYAAFARTALQEVGKAIGTGGDEGGISAAQALHSLVSVHAQAVVDGVLQRGKGAEGFTLSAVSLLQALTVGLVALSPTGLTQAIAAVSNGGMGAHPALLRPLLRACGLTGRDGLAVGAGLLTGCVVGKPSSAFAVEGGKQPLYSAYVLAAGDAGDASVGLQMLGAMSRDGVAATPTMFLSLFTTALGARDWGSMDEVQGAMTAAGVRAGPDFRMLLDAAFRVLAREQAAAEGRESGGRVGRLPSRLRGAGAEVEADEREAEFHAEFLPPSLRAVSARVGRGVSTRGGWPGLSSRRGGKGRGRTGEEEREDEEEVRALVAEAEKYTAVVPLPTPQGGGEKDESVDGLLEELRPFLLGGPRPISLVAPPPRAAPEADSALLGALVSAQDVGEDGAWEALLATAASAPSFPIPRGAALHFLKEQGVLLGPEASAGLRDWQDDRMDDLGLLPRPEEEEVNERGTYSAGRDAARRSMAERIAGISGEEEEEEEGEEGEWVDEDGAGGEVVYDGSKPFMPHLTQAVHVAPGAGAPRRLRPGQSGPDEGRPAAGGGDSRAASEKAYAARAARRRYDSTSEEEEEAPLVGGP